MQESANEMDGAQPVEGGAAPNLAPSALLEQVAAKVEAMKAAGRAAAAKVGEMEALGDAVLELVKRHEQDAGSKRTRTTGTGSTCRVRDRALEDGSARRDAEQMLAQLAAMGRHAAARDLAHAREDVSVSLLLDGRGPSERQMWALRQKAITVGPTQVTSAQWRPLVPATPTATVAATTVAAMTMAAVTVAVKTARVTRGQMWHVH